MNKELINFVKLLVDTGNDTGVILIDDNDVPVEISNLNDFFETVMNKFFTANNEYYTEYQKLRKQRSVEGITQ